MFILEQPVNSLLERHPLFEVLCSHLAVWRKSIAMKDFGSPTAKPSWLYSNSKDIGWIDAYKITGPYPDSKRHMVHTWVDTTGKRCISGGKDLKESQTYPRGFPGSYE